MAFLQPKREVRGILPVHRCFVCVGMLLRLHHILLNYINHRYMLSRCVAFHAPIVYSANY
jgi:hypothetical protein